MKKSLSLLFVLFAFQSFSQVPTLQEMRRGFDDLNDFKERLMADGYKITYNEPVEGFPQGGSYILEYNFADGYVEVDIYYSADKYNNEMSVWFYKEAKAKSKDLEKEYATNAKDMTTYYCEAVKGMFIDYQFEAFKGRRYTDPDLDALVFELSYTMFDCSDYEDF